MEMTLQEIKEKVKKEGLTPEQTIALLDEYIAANPNDDEALTMRGIRHWSCNHRSEAINDYLAALKINPESKAKMAMQATYDILDFYNKDLYNP